MTPSHLNSAVSGPRKVTPAAAERKRLTYVNISVTYRSMSIAAETSGPLGEEVNDLLLYEPSHRITPAPGEHRAIDLSLRRIGVTVQRKNAAYVFETAADFATSHSVDILYL
jgi:hypothetical protein